MEQPSRSDLEELGFWRVPRATDQSAVYVLLLAGAVQYVGQSESFYRRITEHHITCNRNGRSQPYSQHIALGDHRRYSAPFDEVWVKWCHRDRLDLLEQEMIDLLKPKFNIKLRRVLPDVKVDLYDLAESLGIEQWKKPAPEKTLKRRGLVA